MSVQMAVARDYMHRYNVARSSIGIKAKVWPTFRAPQPRGIVSNIIWDYRAILHKPSGKCHLSIILSCWRHLIFTGSTAMSMFANASWRNGLENTVVLILALSGTHCNYKLHVHVHSSIIHIEFGWFLSTACKYQLLTCIGIMWHDHPYLKTLVLSATHYNYTLYVHVHNGIKYRIQMVLVKCLSIPIT